MAAFAWMGYIVEYHSACYHGGAHFNDWGRTLDAIGSFAPLTVVPCRGGGARRRQAGGGRSWICRAISSPEPIGPRGRSPCGGSLKEA